MWKSALIIPDQVRDKRACVRARARLFSANNLKNGHGHARGHVHEELPTQLRYRQPFDVPAALNQRHLAPLFDGVSKKWARVFVPSQHLQACRLR